MKYSPLSSAALHKLLSMENSGFRYSELYGGHHYNVDFPNEFGASIIKHSGSYGRDADLFEVAVLFRGAICYCTPITSDVIGFLAEDEVIKICEEISSLNFSDLADEEDVFAEFFDGPDGE